MTARDGDGPSGSAAGGKTRRRRRRHTRAERVAQIHSIAQHRFASQGYHSVSMDSIGEDAGLSKQMVYNYVGSKESLYLSCFRRAQAELESRIDAAIANAQEPEPQLWHVAEAFLTFVHEEREQWTLLSEQSAALGQPFASEVAAARAEIARLLTQILAEGGAADQAERDTLVLAATVLGAAEGVARWWLDNPGVEKEQVVARLMDVIWMGVGNLAQDCFWDGSPGPALGTG